ncbi:unnamed protein product [Cochlearia groenlandica]
MSQIGRRRRKGRPSKADPAPRRSSSPGESGYELRRGQRRRNVRYNFDFDDYLEEEEGEEYQEEIEEEDAEEERRRQKKKLKQVLKLNQSRARADPPARRRNRTEARVEQASDYEEGEEEEEEEEEAEEDDYEEEASEKRQVKKRRISREEEEEDQADSDEEEDDDDKVWTHCSHTSDTTPILDKKSLELILDKLQKKDIYGVYAEPVDPEELPDYHDMIEHPMDFSTVRKKLSNGSYHTLEELESDVLLICSNAMQYNSSDTVYYKHARTIKEMGKKKFEKARIKIKRAEKELKTGEKVKPGSSGKKQGRQPFSRNSLVEPVASDFSSGVNLVSGGASQNEPVLTQTDGHDKHNYVDVLFEGNTSLVDNLEKEEDLSSGKGLFGKCGKKPSIVEEDQRATYGNSDQQADRSESIFTTFESEIKQFVAVGLHGEHAYGRSLARFAATLGPVAWKIASQRIEQALPADFKFGRGWVGEYEPLPTPVLLFETCTPKEPPKEASMFTKPKSDATPKKNKALFKSPLPPKEQEGNRPVQDGNRAFPFPTSTGAVSEEEPPFVATQARNLKSASQYEYRDSSPAYFAKPQNRIPQQVELNLPPPVEQTSSGSASKNQSFGKSDTVASYRSSRDMMMRNMTPTDSEHYKHQMSTNGIFPGGLSNGKVSTSVNNGMFDFSTDSANQMSQAPAKVSQQPLRKQSQRHGEQAQLMRNFSEKARAQHNTNNQSHISSTQPARFEDPSNASVEAARAWMSIGSGGNNNNRQTFDSPSISKNNHISAESLYNPSREQFHQQAFKPRVPEGTQFHPQRNGFPFETLVHQPVHGIMNRGSEPFQNNRQQIVFPQMSESASDFARFHGQSPWHGGSVTPHVQLKPRQENLNRPPDLNIGVHSPDSPAKQSSGVRVDSQQPDLALQL